jgi:hypothetical protein
MKSFSVLSALLVVLPLGAFGIKDNFGDGLPKTTNSVTYDDRPTAVKGARRRHYLRRLHHSSSYGCGACNHNCEDDTDCYWFGGPNECHYCGDNNRCSKTPPSKAPKGKKSKKTTSSKGKKRN